MRTAGLKGARGATYGLFIGAYPHVVLGIDDIYRMSEPLA